MGRVLLNFLRYCMPFSSELIRLRWLKLRRPFDVGNKLEIFTYQEGLPPFILDVMTDAAEVVHVALANRLDDRGPCHEASWNEGRRLGIERR